MGNFIFKIALLVFIIISIVGLTAKQIDLSENQQQLEELKAKEKQLQMTNEQLNSLLDEGSYDDFIERTLRENGYVRSDETVYTDIGN